MAKQVRFEANEAQKPLITAARNAVDALIIQASGAATLPAAETRRQFGTVSVNLWRDFAADKAGNHPAIANTVYRKIEAYRNANEGVARQYESSFEDALNKLNAVLCSFDQGIPGHGFEPAAVWFRPLNDQHMLFRKDSVVHGPLPQPDYSDFATLSVEEPSAESVLAKLKSDGLCWLRGKAARGKTTTGLVAAFTLIKEGFGAHYLDLSADEDASYGQLRDEWLQLLKRKNVLAIIDNAHRKAGLIEKIVADWSKQPSADRASLLIIGTEVTYHAGSLAESIVHWPPDTLQLEIGEANFAAIARFYVRKSGERGLDIPDRIAGNWARRFGNHLHTFCFAVLDRASTLGQHDNWDLTTENALNWIRTHWLQTKDRLPIPEPLLENLLCLCAFGDQLLELKVADNALPKPAALLNYFVDLGVVKRSIQTRRSMIEHRSSLMEHGWGDLILQAACLREAAAEIRLAAIYRYPRLGLATLSLYRHQGNDLEFWRLLKALNGLEGWWTQVANGPLGSLTGWLVMLNAMSRKSADELRQAILDRFTASPDLLAEFTVGQLADLKGSYSAKSPSLREGWPDLFMTAIAGAEPAPESVFAESLSDGIVATDLNLFYGLQPDSKLHRRLVELVIAIVPASLERALAGNYHQVANLVQKLGQFLPETVGPTLDQIQGNDPTNQDRLDQLAEKARLSDFDPINQLIQHQGTFESRVGRVFYRRFASDDWSTVIPLIDAAPQLVPWLIKGLLTSDMVQPANRFADILAERCRTADLQNAGYKLIEMIALVCRGCSNAEGAQRYLAAMKGKLENQLGNIKTRRSIIADGLWVLVNVDQIRPGAVIAERHLLSRAKPGDLEGREAGDLLRYLGVVSVIVPAASLQPAFEELLQRFPLSAILNHAWTQPESAAKGAAPQPLSSYQQQVWYALYSICKASGQSMLVPNDLRQDVIAGIPPSLAKCAAAQPPNRGQARRLIAIRSWLEAGAELADQASLPCPQHDLAELCETSPH